MFSLAAKAANANEEQILINLNNNVYIVRTNAKGQPPEGRGREKPKQKSGFPSPLMVFPLHTLSLNPSPFPIFKTYYSISRCFKSWIFSSIWNTFKSNPWRSRLPTVALRLVLWGCLVFIFCANNPVCTNNRRLVSEVRPQGASNGVFCKL